MGQVYRALDTNLGREVALKFLSAESAKDEELVKRFINEGRILATIRHRAVVSIYASEFDDETRLPFLVMELVEGLSLEAMKEDLHRDIPRLIHLVIELLEGIHACHQQGIIHRDLKPPNLHLTKDGQLKILDFGIAKVSRNVTQTKVSLGTPFYMSPEQCLGKSGVTPASDVYAIGIILWEFLLNRLPFEAEREVTDPGLSIGLKHLSQEPPWENFDAVPAAAPFKKTIKAMLAKKPEERPTIPEILEILKLNLHTTGSSRSLSAATEGMIGDIYRIEGVLGSGGMGKVYKALDTTLNRVVAIKVLNEETSGDKTLVERFLKEGQLLATVGHPNVLNIYASSRDSKTGRPFLVMEFIDGALLSDLKPTLRKDMARIAPLMLQLFEGIQACHAKGIIHRDLKPSNLMVTREGILKVFDFGIAKTAANLTRTGMTVGTPQYMSPEQCQGNRELSAKSDIYSLGIIFWELVFGEPPFKGDGSSNPELAVAIQHIQGTLPMVALEKENPFLSILPDIRRMLDKDPSSRPAIEDLIADLEELINVKFPDIANRSSTSRRKDSLRRSAVKGVFEEPGTEKGWGVYAKVVFLILLLGGMGLAWKVFLAEKPYLGTVKAINELIKTGKLEEAEQNLLSLQKDPDAEILLSSLKLSLSMEYLQTSRTELSRGNHSRASELARKARDLNSPNPAAEQLLAEIASATPSTGPAPTATETIAPPVPSPSPEPTPEPPTEPTLKPTPTSPPISVQVTASSPVSTQIPTPPPPETPTPSPSSPPAPLPATETAVQPPTPTALPPTPSVSPTPSPVPADPEIALQTFLARLDDELRALQPPTDPYKILLDLTRLEFEMKKPDHARPRRTLLFERFFGYAVFLRKDKPEEAIKAFQLCKSIDPARPEPDLQISAIQSEPKTPPPPKEDPADLLRQARGLSNRNPGSRELPGILEKLDSIGRRKEADAIRSDILADLKKQAASGGNPSRTESLLKSGLRLLPSGNKLREPFVTAMKALIPKQKAQSIEGIEQEVENFQPTSNAGKMIARLKEVKSAGKTELFGRLIGKIREKYLASAREVEEKDPAKALRLLKAIQGFPGLKDDKEIKEAMGRVSARNSTKPKEPGPDPTPTPGQPTPQVTSPDSPEPGEKPPGSEPKGDLATQLEDLTQPDNVEQNLDTIIRLTNELSRKKNGKGQAAAFRKRAANALVDIADENASHGANDAAGRVYGMALKLVPGHSQAKRGLAALKGEKLPEEPQTDNGSEGETGPEESAESSQKPAEEMPGTANPDEDDGGQG